MEKLGPQGDDSWSRLGEELGKMPEHDRDTTSTDAAGGRRMARPKTGSSVFPGVKSEQGQGGDYGGWGYWG